MFLVLPLTSIKNGTRHLGFFSLGNLLGQKEEIKAVSNGRIDISRLSYT
jgi:TRAP-type C4-dicarboxylate transport system substrate-binding protein